MRSWPRRQGDRETRGLVLVSLSPCLPVSLSPCLLVFSFSLLADCTPYLIAPAEKRECHCAPIAHLGKNPGVLGLHSPFPPGGLVLAGFPPFPGSPPVAGSGQRHALAGRRISDLRLFAGLLQSANGAARMGTLGGDVVRHCPGVAVAEYHVLHRLVSGLCQVGAAGSAPFGLQPAGPGRIGGAGGPACPAVGRSVGGTQGLAGRPGRLSQPCRR